jgi:hypothetical protein
VLPIILYKATAAVIEHTLKMHKNRHDQKEDKPKHSPVDRYHHLHINSRGENSKRQTHKADNIHHFLPFDLGLLELHREHFEEANSTSE